MRLKRSDNPQGSVPRARHLRRTMTMPERVLWNLLRDRRQCDLKFRRQVPVGPYTADFYCADAGLIVELDGASHAGDRREHDAERDKWMQDRGLVVLRFSVSTFMRAKSGVVRSIVATAKARIEEKRVSAGQPSAGGRVGRRE